eukprot:TRINITY_DN17097_c0_g1_i1.p2 TRINITY_DN17097_c0_g1~~TRINITY_DN17097_c0_g1_i1.p2  ORF type:complete len:131 (-),score=63.88 TRINITY_DN17097_c0_g1_i1:7-399(-)
MRRRKPRSTQGVSSAESDVYKRQLRRLLGVKSEGKTKQERIVKIKKGELLLVNIGSTSTGANVLDCKAEAITLQLLGPVCTEIGETIALSRRVANWRLIGWGEIIKVYPCLLYTSPSPRDLSTSRMPSSA